MTQEHPQQWQAEVKDWLESLDDALFFHGRERVRDLLQTLQIHAQKAGVDLPVTSQTPYVNTIPCHREPVYPGDRQLERRIKSIVRWNAAAMVVRANREKAGIGGHISSFASAATLYEVAFHHIFRGPHHPCGGDLIFFQGHSSPGVYARAFLEGRLSEAQLANFRSELAPGGGLSSYPHPRLMPGFWQVPTVSMGLGPLMAIYQARFMRYLSDRGLVPYRGAQVYAFLGDGETDEPEALGAISLASRERLGNLTFVINCNLQRLDGPVRGNGSIIQELEAVFRGAGWNVLKVIWGSDWDPLLQQDRDGLLAHRMSQIVDGEYQKYAVEGGAYIRQKFWGADPRLVQMVAHLSDQALMKLRLGGHDPQKVYAAFQNALHETERPSVILARTIKGYGLGEAGEGKNITHQQKKMNEAELLEFRDRFDIPLTDEQVKQGAFYKPSADSQEMEYLRSRRHELGGFVPQRLIVDLKIKAPGESFLKPFAEGTGQSQVSTTMAFVRILNTLLKDPELRKSIVPIIPDEARTFGMEGMFRQYGIYSHVGQLYEPVDADQLMYYKEAKDGIILEEGITEAGGMSSFIAAGTSYALHGRPMIPFFIFYSMFGFQRIGDLIWAAGDMQCRGFLIGATAGRTTLNGEGLQHQDGHSHVLASTVPTVESYDPAFAFELAVIIQDGIRRMYDHHEDVFYYITVGNENVRHLSMPPGVERDICRGAYCLSPAPEGTPADVTLLGSGPMVHTVLRVQKRLWEEYQVAAEVFSVTSYLALRRDALQQERRRVLAPECRVEPNALEQIFGRRSRPFVAVSDFMKSLSDGLAKWLPGPLVSLGTDGFGRSETREALRDFFEIDDRYVLYAALGQLSAQGKRTKEQLKQDRITLDINPDKANPMTS
jgi:pyruvate dehydrogenase E1 component